MTEHNKKEEEKNRDDLKKATDDKAEVEQRIADTKKNEGERAQESASDSKKETEAA